MSNNNSSISLPIKGMNRDAHPQNLDANSYDLALNAEIESFDGNGMPMLSNAPSNIKAVDLPIGYAVMGERYIIEQDRVILFLAGETDSIIGEIIHVSSTKPIIRYDDFTKLLTENVDYATVNQIKQLDTTQAILSFHLITQSDCLGFQACHKAEIAYKITSCGLQLYWVDNFNDNRFLYFDYANTADSTSELAIQQGFFQTEGTQTGTATDNNCQLAETCCEVPIYTTSLDCNKIKVLPDLERLCIYPTGTTNGDLTAGVYQFFACYADVKGNAYSDYTPATNPVPLGKRKITTQTNYNSGNGIAIEIMPDALTRGIYQYYNLAVAATINGSVSYYLLGTYPIGQVKHTVTTIAQAASLTENDLFARKVYYHTARSVSRSNDYLFYNGLKEYSKGNWQRVASYVTIYWQTVVLPEGAYADGSFAARYRSYLRDEVVPFGLVIEFTNGEETPALPLIGRAATEDDRSIIGNADLWADNSNCVPDTDCCGKQVNLQEKWRIYNTASVLFTNAQFNNNDFSAYDPCKENIYQWGAFGYWESTECYPDNIEVWGELACTPIRHFKFPDCSISHIHDKVNIPANGSYGVRNYIFPIGVKVDNDSFNTAVDNALKCGYITAEMKSRIRGYRIVRGNRVGQQSIVAKGLLYDVNKYNKNNIDFYYPNYPYNDLRPDELISPSGDTYNQPNSEVQDGWKLSFSPNGRYTFHSPNTHFGQPSIDSLNELKLEVLSYGQSEGYFNEHLEHAKYKFLSTAAYVLGLSAGVAAALTATDSQTQCREFVYRGIQGYEKGHVEGAGSGVENGSNSWSEGSDKGESPYPDISGQVSGEVAGALTAIEGDITGDTTTTEGHGDYWGNNYTQKGNNINASTGAFNANTNDMEDPGDLNGSSGITGGKGNAFENIHSANNIDELRVKSCRSTHWQNLNSSGLNSVFGSVFSSLGLTGVTPEGLLYKISLGLAEMKKVTDFLQEMIPRVQYAFQYNSIGFYNCYQPLGNDGNRRRQLIGTAYLTPDSQLIQENTAATHFNNWNRESSVYLHINGLLNNPAIIDESRYTVKDAGNCSSPTNRSYRTISSYYAAVKSAKPGQYGSISDIEWLETGHCPISYPGTSLFSFDTMTIFGGDTFINRFALKRKHSFFKYTAYKFPENGDIYYSEIGNVGYPNYYFDTHKGLLERLEDSDLTSMLAGVLLGPVGGGVFNYFLTGSTGNPYSAMEQLLGVNMHRLNCGYESGGWSSYIPFLDNSAAPGFKKFFYQKGYVYTHYYGIPYFLCESDVNLDLRYGTNGLEGDFYPHNADLDFWLQQKNVDPTEDNQYHYNYTYSKQNREGVIFKAPKDYEPLKDCKINHINRVIYTEQYQQNEVQDAWLIHKAANFYDFPFSSGSLTAVDGIENNKVLARFDNGFSIFNAFVELNTNSDTLAIGNGGMFANRPQEFSNSDIGHAGAQHTALLRTEFGHVWVDAARGQVILLGSNGTGIESLSDNGLRNWFAENLPFRMKHYFPSLTSEDLDNSYNGLGIAMAYDNRFHRLFLTKLDYQPLRSDIAMRRNENGCVEFYLNDSGQSSQGSGIILPPPVSAPTIPLTDTNIFCNRSWTISYNFLTGTWVSYHSFIPNYYIPLTQYFLSGINISQASIWCHNITNRHYQTYYGINYPFIIQIIGKHDVNKKFLAAVEFEMDAYRYQGESDCFSDLNITFNKAIIFNNSQCTGLLNLMPRNENDMRQLMYPKSSSDATEILVTRTEQGWRFNQFYDQVFNHRNNIPPMIYSCNNVFKDINPLAISYSLPDLKKERIRNDFNYVRLINDSHFDHRFIFRWLINNTVKVYS